MWTKPHYRQIPAADVKPGMRVYSRLLDEAFTVESTYAYGPTLFLQEGIFTATVARRGRVWIETKPRMLR